MVLVGMTRRLPDEGCDRVVRSECSGGELWLQEIHGLCACRKCQSWMPQWIRRIRLCEGLSCSCKVMKARVRRVGRSDGMHMWVY